MSTFKVEIHRKIAPVSFPYVLKTHLVDTLILDDDSKVLAEACLGYSREAADSTVKVEPNLFFLMKDAQGLPVLYGSPNKTSIKWSENGWDS